MRSLAPFVGFPLRLLEARVLGRRRPLLSGYKITQRCNLHCVHCPFWRRPGPEPNAQEARIVLDRLHAAGVRLLIFEGGEPLLWRDGDAGLGDLVRYAKERFWSVGVISNGTLPLPDDPDVVWVSVDGLEETTARIRGPIYQRQMENIERSRHPRLYANVTISTLNVAEVPALVEELASRVRGITIQFYYPYEDDLSLFVPFDQRRELLERLIEMKRKGYPLLDSEDALRALQAPGWRCHPWLVSNANPDGSIQQGCYLKGRGPVACERCGFAAHVEMSLAFDLNPGALRAGLTIFGLGPGG
ncbi:MAG: DUF3463 domain-containing protein [Anaerolineae bacterium]|nr:DUF3463 domain-containing protein [Anaerolineae bacterium]